MIGTRGHEDTTALSAAQATGPNPSSRGSRGRKVYHAPSAAIPLRIMRHALFLRPWTPIVLLATWLLIGCDRDDDDTPTRNPSIDLLTDPGYTYASDTFGMGDSLRVGVRIRRGDDPLRTFKVLSRYDGGPDSVRDSMAFTADTLAFDKVIHLRPQAGTERWTFWVQERDGDIIRRSLTFTVQ